MFLLSQRRLSYDLLLHLHHHFSSRSEGWDICCLSQFPLLLERTTGVRIFVPFMSSLCLLLNCIINLFSDINVVCWCMLIESSNLSELFVNIQDGGGCVLLSALTKWYFGAGKWGETSFYIFSDVMMPKLNNEMVWGFN